MTTPKNITEFWGEPISVYTVDQATEDGLLLELAILKHKINGIDAPNSPFSHITVNLLKKLGYMTEDYQKNEIEFNYPNLLDLLNQALQILKRNPRGDHLYIGKIETPNGDKTKIYIALNEKGKFTIELPEDY